MACNCSKRKIVTRQPKKIVKTGQQINTTNVSSEPTGRRIIKKIVR